MKKPNILLITSDQQHWNTLGAYNSEVKTPNLDRLIREGMTFDRAYCPNPTCTPTRGSIITGQYPSQHGGWTLGTKVPETAHTLGEDLTKAGYKTALVGKAHFQPLASTEEFQSIESYPTLQDLDFWRHFNDQQTPWYGFQHCELTRNHTDEAHVGQHYAIWLEDNKCKDWKQYFRQPTGYLEDAVERCWLIPENYHYNNWIAERSNALMETYVDNNEPFFMWSSFFDPHPSYCVPEPFYSMYDPDTLTLPPSFESNMDQMPPHHQMTQMDNPDFSIYKDSGFANHGMCAHKHPEAQIRKQLAIYYGMITMMDKYIGKILDKLDHLGIADNTLIVFTTDHGHFLGHHSLNYKGPFLYEDMIKIPWLVRQPGKVPANVRSNAMQSSVDLTPTFLKMLGLDVPGSMTGVDQSRVWLGHKDSARDHIICEDHHEPTSIHLKTYVDQRYKLTVYYKQTYGELFDLDKDPNELNNLWDSEDHKDLKASLMLKYIWAELGKEPMWMPRIAHA